MEALGIDLFGMLYELQVLRFGFIVQPHPLLFAGRVCVVVSTVVWRVPVFRADLRQCVQCLVLSAVEVVPESGDPKGGVE